MRVIDPNGCYNKAEAAEILDVSESTLQRYFHQGLKARRPRGRIHILGCDILEFLKQDHGSDEEQPVMTNKLENRVAKAVLDIRKGRQQARQEAAGR